MAKSIFLSSVALSALLYTFIGHRTPRNERDRAFYFIYNPTAPKTKQAYRTYTNYIQVPMEKYIPTGEGQPNEHGLITLSATTAPGNGGKYPDFSSGKITFDPETGFPNGGTDFIENDTDK